MKAKLYKYFDIALSIYYKLHTTRDRLFILFYTPQLFFIISTITIGCLVNLISLIINLTPGYTYNNTHLIQTFVPHAFCTEK